MTIVPACRPLLKSWWGRWFSTGLAVLMAGLVPLHAKPSVAEDEQTVAALDVEYQAAVKRNDADAMARILADDFVLVLGRGVTYAKADLLKSARDKKIVYEKQDELKQTVRLWGDTAVVTALLWIKGSNDGVPFDRKLWFSDVYVRTLAGWRYVLGQASLPLPDEPAK